MAIGHTPGTALFNGQIEMDANGYIVTHHGAKTSVEGRVCVRRRRITSIARPSRRPEVRCMAALDAERYLER
jgi:thioredoxin reductase (NADPH)